MEHTVRLLAAELAVKRITVNAICPSFVPAGMNQHADERRRKLEAAQVPLGRLCQPEDIAGMIRWLVSPGASFVSGQVLGLTGAQL
jgi:3-oxoacyl-[acyl-carrier protein] reductase